MPDARGATTETALAFESTYGTPPASGFFTIPFVQNTLGEMQGRVPDDLLGVGNDPLESTADVIEVKGGMVVPVGVESFGLWLKLLLGDPGTTGSAPYTHVFESGSSDILSASIEKGHPEVPLYTMYSGVVANGMNIDMAFGRGQKLTCSFDLMGQGFASEATSDAGTLATLSTERFSHANGSILRDGSAAKLLSASVKYTKNLEAVEAIRADGLVDHFSPGKTALTGQVRARFADTAMYDLAVAGTAMALTFDWEISAGKKLTIAAPNSHLTVPKREVQGPNGVDVTFDFTSALQTNGEPMMVVTLVNEKASY
ncbi:phage tail tube protein [Pseudoroseicyclus sp. CXY001]|uniref:phage tail tube protein n=1 Tax=Pseudoroseicyclus sp. CXY001 TaxID=3242492 RepID=UPI00357119A3